MGIFNKILDGILKSRIKTVVNVMADDPQIKKLAKNVNKATDKLKKSIEKTKKRGQSMKPDEKIKWNKKN